MNCGPDSGAITWLRNAEVLKLRRSSIERDLEASIAALATSASRTDVTIHNGSREILELLREGDESHRLRSELFADLEHQRLKVKHFLMQSLEAERLSSSATRSFGRSALCLQERIVSEALQRIRDTVSRLQQEEGALLHVEDESVQLLAQLRLHDHQESRSTNKSAASVHRDPHVLPTRDAPDESAAVQHMEFLEAHGGVTLGWTAEDHNIFLRCFLRMPTGSPHELLEYMAVHLPHQTPDSLLEHLALHAEDMRLQELKRLAVQSFREQRAQDAEIAARVSETETKLRKIETLEHEQRRELARRKHAQELHDTLLKWKSEKEDAERQEQRMQQNSAAGDAKALREGEKANAMKHPNTHSSHLHSHPTPNFARCTRAEAVAAQPEARSSTSLSIVQRQAALEQRHADDLQRTATRRGIIEAKRLIAGVTKADVTHALAEKLTGAAKTTRSESCGPQSSGRLLKLTESAAMRRAANASDSQAYQQDTLGSSRTAQMIYLTPRNAAGTHRAPASWCSKSYMKL